MPTGSFISKSSGDFITAARVKSALTHAVLDARLTDGGMQQKDADTLVDGVTLDTLQVKKDGSLVKTNAEASLWKGYVMAFLLSMTTMIYGMNVARSIIQEKTSRIFEVMLAIARPGDLLAGKLIGIGAVGLTQIRDLAGRGRRAPFVSTRGRPDERRVRCAFLVDRGGTLPGLFCAWVLALQLAVCGARGDMRNGAGVADVYAACRCADVAEFCLDPAGDQRFRVRSGRWLRRCFRLTGLPVIMFLRMASEIPPAWRRLAVSIGLLMLSIWGVLWFSTRLYRVGILMYGKRATLPELMRWLRYS